MVAGRLRGKDGAVLLLALLAMACNPGGGRAPPSPAEAGAAGVNSDGQAGPEAMTTAADRTAASLIVHVEIPVTDMERAMRFYTAVFGAAPERQLVDGYDMALFPAGEGPGATVALARGDVYRPSKDGAILYFRVADIRATMARAVQAGGSVLYPVKDIGEPGFVGEIADSEGNRIALSQPRG